MPKQFSIRFTRKSLLKFLKRTGLAFVGMVVLFFLLHWVFPPPPPPDFSPIVTDQKGEIIHAYLTTDEKWRMVTELEEISPLLQKTIIAKEDKYFYSHPGINPVAVTRAFFKNLFRLKRTSGASTITMQVARLLEPRKRNIGSKIIEMFRALQLELKYSKKEILQLYLNLVPYGGNIEGVKAAAFLYFNKAPDHLSLAEITALSIIPNRPSSLVIGRHNARIVEERNRWLQKFATEKVFTQKEIADALAEPMNASRGTVPRHIPHLAYRLKRQGGHLIPTWINLNTQLKTERLVEDYIRGLKLRQIRNAAVVIIDNKTHQVITYVGSSSFQDTTDGGQVNGAKAIRQPGSTLKPLLYGLCIDEGLLTPKSVMTDVAVNYQGYAPENYDEKFNGYITMEYALEHSLNIPAVKGLRLLGKDKLVSKLSACDFRQIRKDQNKLGLSMILGGCGTTLEELTGLFSAFAQDGTWYAPQYLRTGSTPKQVRILSPAANFMVTDILSKVNRPDFPLNWGATEKMPRISWKTGTSYGRRDAWSIGYNKHFTVGVWVGNFSGLGIADLSGAQTATPLLFRIFNTIDYDTENEWNAPPEDCALRQVCSETGLVPSPYCQHIVMDYFIPLVSSTLPCANRQEVMMSPDEKISYCKSCMPNVGYKKKMIRLIEPEMQNWYEENQLQYERVPPHNPECEVVFKGKAPLILSPTANSEYYISKKNPEPLQLACQTGNDVDRVYWYVDDQFYRSASPGEKLFFVPREGPVKISCTDDKGRNNNIRITVKFSSL